MGTIKNFCKVEWSKLREMSFKDKRQYIWEYYKLHIIGILVFAIFVWSMLNTFIFNPAKREYLYIAWIGIPVFTESLTDLGNEFSIIVEDETREAVFVIDYTLTENRQLNNSLQTRFFAMLQSGSMDLFFTTYQGAYELATEGFSTPVYDVLESVRNKNPELYRNLQGRLTTITYQRNDVLFTNIMAISLSDAIFFESFDFPSSDLYLAVVSSNPERFDRVAKLLEVIFNGD